MFFFLHPQYANVNIFLFEADNDSVFYESRFTNSLIFLFRSFCFRKLRAILFQASALHFIARFSRATVFLSRRAPESFSLLDNFTRYRIRETVSAKIALNLHVR